MSLSLEAQMSAEREQPGFRNRRGQTAASKAASQILDAAITAEVKRLTLHKLRHTIASMLLARPVAITKVSNLLGQKEVSVRFRHHCANR